MKRSPGNGKLTVWLSLVDVRRSYSFPKIIAVNMLYVNIKGILVFYVYGYMYSSIHYSIQVFTF